MLWTEMLYNQVDKPMKSKFEIEEEENIGEQFVDIENKFKNKMREKEEY